MIHLSASSDVDSEEEIDTSLLLDTKNVDQVGKKESEVYTSNPYMNIDDKPYVIELVQKSLVLCKYRLITVGTAMVFWKMLFIIGMSLFMSHRKKCQSVNRWSIFSLCVLGYMSLTSLGIFCIELYIWIKGKHRLAMSQGTNVKPPDIVVKMMQSESLIDLLCIGNKINDVTVRRKMIESVAVNKNKKSNSGKCTATPDKHCMLKAINKVIDVSKSTIHEIPVPNKKELYNQQADDLVNKYFLIWIGIPILFIVIWLGIAINNISNDFINQTGTFNDIFHVENITSILHIYMEPNENCGSFYIFNIIMMVLVSLQTVAAFIPFFIRLVWSWQ